MTLPTVVVDAGSTVSGAAEVDPASASGNGNIVKPLPAAVVGPSLPGPLLSSALPRESSGNSGASAELFVAACDTAPAMGDAVGEQQAFPSVREDGTLGSVSKHWSGTGPCAATCGDGASGGAKVGGGASAALESAAGDAGGAAGQHGMVTQDSSPGRAGIAINDSGTGVLEPTAGVGVGAPGDGGRPAADDAQPRAGRVVGNGGTAAQDAEPSGDWDAVGCGGATANDSEILGKGQAARGGGMAARDSIRGGGGIDGRDVGTTEDDSTSGRGGIAVGHGVSVPHDALLRRDVDAADDGGTAAQDSARVGTGSDGGTAVRTSMAGGGGADFGSGRAVLTRTHAGIEIASANAHNSALNPASVANRGDDGACCNVAVVSNPREKAVGVCDTAWSAGRNPTWDAQYDCKVAAVALLHLSSGGHRRFSAAERGRLAPIGIDAGLEASGFDARSMAIADTAMAELRILLGSSQEVTGRAALAVSHVRAGLSSKGSYRTMDLEDSLSELVSSGREMRSTAHNVYNLVSMLQRHMASRSPRGECVANDHARSV